MKFNGATYNGNIYKVNTSGNKFDIVIHLTGSTNFNKWLSKTFHQSTYSF